MRFRLPFLIALTGLLLSACNFTLAADITPPPNYVAPPPLPTLGPLHPAVAPDLRNGQTIYVEKCLPCHGETGLGDGAQGKQLPVTVAALGLPEVAGAAQPARWYTVVSQGNIERYMPPFESLSEQDRWDVVGYALSLHITPQMLEQGKEIFTSKCEDCPVTLFRDQEKMASLSEADLTRLIREGGDGAKAFGSGLSDEQVSAAAAYLRTLSFAAPVDAAAVAPAATEAVSNPESGTSAAAMTPPADLTPAPEGAPVVEPSGGQISGTVANKSGATLASGLTITLRGYDHTADSGGPQETLTLEGTLASDGTYRFDNVELVDGRLFVAELDYEGINYQTPFSSLPTGEKQLGLPPITVYDTSEDFSTLNVDQLHMAFDFGTGDSLQVFEIFSFTNSGDKAIVIKSDGTQIPFIVLPEGAQNVGFEAGQNTAPFSSTADGLALLPSETPYSLIAFFSLPYDSKGTSILQPMRLKTDSVSVFLPEGIKLKGDGLTDKGVQNISGTNFHMYSASALDPDSELSFSLSGKPDSGGTGSPSSDNRMALIYGAAALGLALIGLGTWMYLRDRSARPLPEDGPDEGPEFEDPESVMDAIIALDDLYRARKIPETAYQERRAELKEQLRKLESRS